MKPLSFSAKIAVVSLGFAASWAAAQSGALKTVVRIEHALVTLIDDVKVPAREAGSLMELTAKEGDLVEKGGILGQLDNLDALAKREIAHAELEVAQTQADSTAELDAAKKGAEVALAEHQQFLDIQRRNKGAVSEFEIRRAKFTHEKSLAQIQVAETDRTVAQITTKLKKAQITATENELTRRQVQAPLAGQVVEMYKHVGEWCTPGEPILRVVRVDRVRVEGFVLTSAASPASILGKPVKVTVFTAGGGTHEVQGTVGFASLLVEGAGSTRQFRVWTEVDNTQVNGHWVIQPGSAAEMLIDLNPTVARPAQVKQGSPSTPPPLPRGFAPRLPTPSNSFPALPPAGGKLESRKPVIEAAPTPDAKSEPKAAPAKPAPLPSPAVRKPF